MRNHNNRFKRACRGDSFGEDDRDSNEGEDECKSEIEITEKMIEKKKNRILECLREIRKDDFLDSGTTSFSSSFA